jgi:hypothetical protein
MILDKISAIEARLIKLEGSKQGDGIISETRIYDELARIDAKGKFDEFLDIIDDEDDINVAMKLAIRECNLIIAQADNDWHREYFEKMVEYLEE